MTTPSDPSSPTPGSPTPESPTPEAGAGSPDRRRAVALVTGGVVVLLLVVAAAVVLLTRGDDVTTTTTGTTTSTAAPGSTSTVTSSVTTSTTSTSSTTATTTKPGVVTDEEASTIVWPDPAGGVSYTTATAAVEGFAVDLVGFDDPVIGELQEGDSRSGEVELRSDAAGPVTTVLVRQMGDDHWYVIGSTTPDIVVDDPIAGTAIDTPLIVAGKALAFEGTVNVSVVQRGDTEPLGEGVVTGGGSELAPFSGQIDWANPVGGWGTVLFWTVSAEDGSVMQVTAIPVGFIGGD